MLSDATTDDDWLRHAMIPNSHLYSHLNTSTPCKAVSALSRLKHEFESR